MRTRTVSALCFSVSLICSPLPVAAQSNPPPVRQCRRRPLRRGPAPPDLLNSRKTPKPEAPRWESIPQTGPRIPRNRGTFSPNKIGQTRSEEHTSELQSHSDLVCRLLLEKKKTNKKTKNNKIKE